MSCRNLIVKGAVPVYYHKLYAYLLGEIDEALTMMEEAVTPAEVTLRLVFDKLQQALLKAEEMCLREEEENDN